ncbi:DUF2795 domain-containing protein [Streptomyces sp. ISL-98]|uniref:DUF2795 domain-containing protein n=1 Tax=Streptomyces sp. ISL-98 TaxID=2819192 RepID=UPI001BE647D7|nr:DUF2795 domain-containing protein [Streptomyces sp. ISL-98]MBT2510539.1 DUF2795 domain-containing protein [Streptomyces sp. ISL-98]
MNQHGKNKISPLRDDEIKRELQGELMGGHSTRSKEEREFEPSGEDQPYADRSPHTPLTGSTPPGMTPEDVQLRTEMGRHLGRSLYPADRAKVLETLRENNAPDRLVETASRLPDDGTYASAQDILRGLGRGGGGS